MNKPSLTTVFLLALLVSFTACSQNQNKNNMDSKNVYIGMDINDFKKIYPEIYSNTQAFKRKETIAGIDGAWYYDFKDSKLKWFKLNIPKKRQADQPAFFN